MERFQQEDGALVVSGEVLMNHQLREEGLSISAIVRRVALDVCAHSECLTTYLDEVEEWRQAWLK